MKLSFAVKHWQGYNWTDFCCMAKEMDFTAIEICNNKNYSFADGKDPFKSELAASVVRKMQKLKLQIICLDTVCNIAQNSRVQENIKLLNGCLQRAYNLKIPYIRVYAEEFDMENSKESVIKVLESALEKAAEKNVSVLIETKGEYADTEKLRDILNHFASDNLAAMWNVTAPFAKGEETPEQTVQNLGAYIKYVGARDFNRENGGYNYCLMGEGILPIEEFINALRSINYDGFVSVEWNKEWLSQVDDIEIILSHFSNFMNRFDNPSRMKKTLPENKIHTGKFVWKKDILIDYTFSQILDKMVDEFPDQYAVKYTTLDYTRTYSQFRDDVDNFARSLVAIGVKSGHHVALWATNIPQWYIAFWAVTKIGAVLVSMNTAYKIHEAEYLLRQSDTHTLIMVNGYRDSDYKDIISRLCPELENTKAGDHLHSKRLPFLRNVITVGFEQAGCMTWQQAIDKGETVPVEEVYRMAAAVNSHDVCNMQYTSGTTGFPKGVMLTHYNIVNNGKCIGDRMDLSTADRMMIQVPMFHCFGMVLAMTAAMTHGATVLPLPYFSPKPALACINSENITCFHGVPTMFIALLQHPDFSQTDFSYMRTGIMAGSPCPVAVMQDVMNKMNMKEITIVYGQTESSPGCTMSSADDPIDVRVSTVGSPLPEIECKIVNPETWQEVADGETGEFVARGYNIMKGYYKMPKATANAIDVNGWLHTGDLACRTPEGNFKITGRLKDMIIRGGENIYPKEIEEFIYTHPKVKDVQVIGVPDSQYGEEIMACIILKENETMTAEEMKNFIKDNMARHKVPKYIDFTHEFPMNVAGKVLKYKMRENAIEKLNLGNAAKIVTA